MSFVIDAPEAASEFATHVLAGLLKAVRAYVPTYENEEGKKVHSNVPVVDGVIYVADEHAVATTVIRPDLLSMCKKRGQLRHVIAEHQGLIRAELNYGSANPWIKQHGKNVKAVRADAGGVSVSVVDGFVELALPLGAEKLEEAEAVRRLVASRTAPDRLLAGPFPLDPAGADGEFLVVHVDQSGARLAGALEVGSPAYQLRLKGNAFNEKAQYSVSVFSDHAEECVVFRLASSTEALSVDQLFRALKV